MQLGKYLSRPGSIEELLRENYMADTSIEAKVCYLESLEAVCKQISKDDDLIQDALHLRRPELAFAAVKLIGLEGSSLVQEIFAVADDQLKIKVLEYLSSNRNGFLIPYLKDVRIRLSNDVKEILARYYQLLGVAEAEQYLQREIDEDEMSTNEYKISCIQALGACGTYNSIAFLDNHRGLRLYQEIDQAIASIQNRIGSGDAGWLSVQDSDELGTEDGALSISGDEGCSETDKC